MKDIQWKDLDDAQIDQNVMPSVCGSNLVFKHSNAKVGLVAIDGIDDDIASEIYTLAQAQEQAWEEKRRVRAMEERRAGAGGMVVHAAPAAGASTTSSGSRLFDEIEKAKQLYDAGAISDSEFQELKSKILSAV